MRNRDKFLKGFTLLELLIVIALIGLLASIVLVSFKGATERARIAQGLQFSDSLRGALQMDMVGWWPLDRINGNITPDNWFDRNDGTVYGAQLVEGIVNNALSFNGNDYVSVADDNILNPVNTITFEAWIYSIGGGVTWHGIVSKGNGQTYALTLNRPNMYFHFETHGGPGTLNTPVDIISPNVWVHVVATYNGNEQKIYVNGEEKAKRTISGNLATNSEALRIGQGNNGEYFRGSIDEVRIYSQALPSAQIQKHYVKGLKRHQDLVKR